MPRYRHGESGSTVEVAWSMAPLQRLQCKGEKMEMTLSKVQVYREQVSRAQHGEVSAQRSLVPKDGASESC